jgi:hypothetical protein
MTFGAFAEHTLTGYYAVGPAEAKASGDDAPHQRTADYPAAAAAKDVAPAAVHLAAAAAGRQLAHLVISHE